MSHAAGLVTLGVNVARTREPGRLCGDFSSNRSQRPKGVVMPLKTLKEFLDANKVKYVVISHSPAYTAQEIAGSAHIPGKNLAKTVMVRLDGKMAMVVLPAPCKIDFALLKEVAGAKEVELAQETDFAGIFPGCEVGAMPPFGNLYDLETYMAEALAEDDQIAFNAGSHTELVKLAYADYQKLVKPKVARLTH
jgi:Ala-tRNA(Pro) deacylase